MAAALFLADFVNIKRPQTRITSIFDAGIPRSNEHMPTPLSSAVIAFKTARLRLGRSGR